LVRYYIVRVIVKLVGYGSPRDGTPDSERMGEVSGNTFLLIVILMMILLFCLISLGPLIFF
jgi:hypothetical protein